MAVAELSSHFSEKRLAGAGFPYIIAVVIWSGTRTRRLCKLNYFLVRTTAIGANEFYLSFFINWFMAVHVVTPQSWTELR